MSARGRARHDALVVAAATLLGRDGPAALSARAVAGEAGVPLAAVSYYFDSVDELVRAGAERLYEGYLRAATHLVERAVLDEATDDTDVARLLVRVWLDPTDAGPDPARVRSLLTSLASAAQVPALAPRLRRYDQGLTDLVADVLGRTGRDPGRVRVLLAALDGFALARLSGVDVRAAVPAAVPTAGRVDEGGAGPAPSLPTGPDDLAPEGLLAGLAADLGLVLDDLAPGRTGRRTVGGTRQNSRAVGSSRPDNET